MPDQVSNACCRAVWAAYSADPHASIREIAERVCWTQTPVAYARERLIKLGYLERQRGKRRTTTVRIPLITRGDTP